MEYVLLMGGGAAGLVWAGDRFRALGRWPYFLTLALFSLIALTLAGLLLWPQGSLTMMALPAAAGLLAALVVYWSTPDAAQPAHYRLGAVSALGLAGLLAVLWQVYQGPLAVIMVVSGGVAGLAWQAPAAQGRWRWAAWLAVLGVLVGGPLVWVLTPEVKLAGEPSVFAVLVWAGCAWVWPGLAILLAGRLTAAVLGGAGSLWRRAAGLLAAVGLAAAVGVYAYSQLPWDAAVDGLWAVTTVGMAATPAAIVAGMLMAWSLRGWPRLGALAFAGLVPLALFQVVSGGLLAAKPTELTAARAAAVAEAIELYQADHGRYPAALAELPFWYSTRLYEPVILRDETWCYEGGADFFRLAYIYRPAFGVPAEFISVKVAASAGRPPARAWVCDDRLAYQQAHAPR